MDIQSGYRWERNGDILDLWQGTRRAAMIMKGDPLYLAYTDLNTNQHAGHSFVTLGEAVGHVERWARSRESEGDRN